MALVWRSHGLSKINKVNMYKSGFKQRSFGIHFISILLVLCAQQAAAQSSVWKAEKNGRHIYLGGTIHLLTKADYPLPGEFDLAYNNSQIVYFETDIEKLKTPQFSVSVSKAFKATTKKSYTLDQALKPDTLLVLRAYLDKRKLKFGRFRNHSPGRVYLALMSLELARKGLVGVGVDEHFAKRARLDKKRQNKFETIDEHLSLLSKLSGGSPDQMILKGLQDMQNISATVAGLKKIWRSGDREQLRNLVLNPYKQDYPSAYQILLQDRNNQWMPKIEGLFQTAEVEFVLVGAMHMIGQGGILQRLEAKGYKVEPL